MAMKIEVMAIANHGDEKNEYVMLRVNEYCELQFFILVDTTFLEPGYISNKMRHPFWFPEKMAAPGDIIILFTQSGINNSVQAPAGNFVHSFYWNLKAPVWNDEGDRCTIIELEQWKTWVTR